MTIRALMSLSKRVLPYRVLRERDPEEVLPYRMLRERNPKGVLPYRMLRERESRHASQAGGASIRGKEATAGNI